MRRESREKVEVVFSTKTKATAPRKDDDRLLPCDQHPLSMSTGSINSRQDTSETHQQASGELDYLLGQDSREGSSELETKPEEYKVSNSTENPIRKRGRRPSRKGSSADSKAGGCSVSASVRRLRPSKALLQLESASVAECVKSMVESRTEATLVTDANGTLTGILTDKDIALRVVARGLDPISTIACDVMTPNPSCVSPRACAIEALEQMVSGQFRHLPVADNGSVVGILDIAKCLYDAISKIEQAYMASSSQFTETIQKLDGNIGTTEASLFEKMRETLFLPTLSSLIDGRADIPEIADTATARDASVLMLEKNSSAVMVFGSSGIMEGILTTKDLMRRVLAVGRDPATCLVREIMTSNPDCARLSTSILDALHLMHDGKFLHLPVLNDDGVVVGLADVLQVTCGVVHQMGSFQQQHTSANVNPAWNQFWNSVFNPPPTRRAVVAEAGHADAATVAETLPPPPSTEARDHMASLSIASASLHSASSSSSGLFSTAVAPLPAAASTPLAPPPMSPRMPPGTFAYKLTDHAGNTHRFTASALDLSVLRKQVGDRTGLAHAAFNLHYVDDERDSILLFMDKDLEDAVALAQCRRDPFLRLKVVVKPSVEEDDDATVDDDVLSALPNMERPRVGGASNLTESTILRIKQTGLFTAVTMAVVGTAMLYVKKK
ncbi:Aste57867_11419 [Aphanomyces stellatus]|uniref:Aste57867_11419 protein n=1 Tax=Aphanomyces stellatus TaxID=120398 RepID=A0A485KUT5_9STRA|nr:hypothetical protein As57867_011377 [Aphanomyces stellatus]VFT88280.1 Aste57867_11419 [Aphanomyces stellatus]